MMILDYDLDSRFRGNDETCPLEGGDKTRSCHSRESGNPAKVVGDTPARPACHCIFILPMISSISFRMASPRGESVLSSPIL